jgi:hypothetical protein
MDIKELLDDDTLDPKKYFDKEKYHTLTISLNSETAFKESDVDAIISLMDEHISREDKEDKLKIIKEKKLNHLLLKAIAEAETNEDKARLLSICWESGLDFSNDFLFFVENALHDDYMISLEAHTVAVNMDELKNEELLTKAILLIDNHKNAGTAVANDLKSFILSKTNSL